MPKHHRPFLNPVLENVRRLLVGSIIKALTFPFRPRHSISDLRTTHTLYISNRTRRFRQFDDLALGPDFFLLSEIRSSSCRNDFLMFLNSKLAPYPMSEEWGYTNFKRDIVWCMPQHASMDIICYTDTLVRFYGVVYSGGETPGVVDGAGQPLRHLTN